MRIRKLQIQNHPNSCWPKGVTMETDKADTNSLLHKGDQILNLNWSIEDREVAEKLLLMLYEKEHYELPPLNHVGGL